MILFERTTRETMRESWSRHEEIRRAPAPPVLANLETVLDLGEMIYITFRGKPYGVPPVGWRMGQRLLAARHAAMAAAKGGALTPETTGEYYRALRRCASLCWRLLRPVHRTRTGGAILRWRKRWHLLRNPLHGATDKEVVELVDFCLRRRMVSNGGPLPAIRPQSTTA